MSELKPLSGPVCVVHPGRHGERLEHPYGASGPFCGECVSQSVRSDGVRQFLCSVMALNVMLGGAFDEGARHPVVGQRS